MRIFLSHSTRDKAVVREIISYLPYIKTWLDEEKLLIGGPLEVSIQSAIQEDVDFVMIFLSSTAIQSEWVQRELQWAIQKEKALDRTFILPVLLDDIWDKVEPKEFQKKLYIKCLDQKESTVQDVAKQLGHQLFMWLIRLLDESKKKADNEEHRNKPLADKIEHSLEMARLFPFGRAGFSEQLISLASFLRPQFAFDQKTKKAFAVLSKLTRIDDLEGDIQNANERLKDLSRFAREGVDSGVTAATYSFISDQRKMQQDILNSNNLNHDDFLHAKSKIISYLGSCYERLINK